MLMQNRDRLRVIREHVGKAQAILSRSTGPKARPKDLAAMEKVVDTLKLHLGNDELMRALDGSPASKGKVEQADGKSKLRAKNEQAA
jgi:hypothetical protein